MPLSVLGRSAETACNGLGGGLGNKVLVVVPSPRMPHVCLVIAAHAQVRARPR